MDLGAQQRQVLLNMARQTIRSALGERQTLASQVFVPNDPALHQPAGCFVTLHTAANHRLRGCVGRLDSSESLINVVRQSAASVLQDPRFAGFPVRLNELPQLELEITAILPLVPAADCMDFDLLNEGIYLTVAGRSGCFLPQVAQETGWGKQPLLERLCTEKLGVSADAWRDPSAKLMKFKTLLIGPERF